MRELNHLAIPTRPLLGILLTTLVMVRIVEEEKLLAQQLDGYDEYRRRVGSRLLPHIW
jgi:protein-S-isoprenylcysteine O-methyltransferase Ste14